MGVIYHHKLTGLESVTERPIDPKATVIIVIVANI